MTPTLKTLTYAGLLTLGLNAHANTEQASDHTSFQLQTVVSGLEHPWGLAFLPNGDKLVTERPGRLRIVRDGELLEQPVTGLPELAARGQGGLLDVVLHPAFNDNQQLFLSYAHRNRRGYTTRVARATYTEGALSNVRVIFEAEPRSNNGRHFGSRLAFDEAGLLYISVGDRGEMERAQKMDDDAGAVHRITIDGEVPPDNPFVGRRGHRDTVFSKGNRNIQGMTRHPETGDIWSHEHGPRGGDEINIIRKGLNYGWPTITHGVNYSGLPITNLTKKEGMEQPLHYWTPSPAPSGMAFYTGELLPAWQGDLFIGALAGRKLIRLRLDGETVVEEEDLLTGFGQRIRDVRNGPDGALWLLTDDRNGRLVRLSR
ncbi:MAG: PQQ-dependent sugar dehydrogenase [Marinobacter sp.]|nr:PQQ-dependent sugar dehydrogenase [Marinobacter sp.]